MLAVFPRERPFPAQQALQARVHADTRVAAQAAGATHLDLAGVLAGPARLRCANGYNLNTEGSRRVGEYLSRWILEQRQEADTARDARPVAR